MKRIFEKAWFVLLVFVAAFVMLPENADATSQWGKKYDISCQVCHTAFPRLTYMGEKFMRDGYQFDQDGDENKNRVSSKLVLDELENLFGIRLNLRPVEFKTNSIREGGSPEDRITFGETNWVQFFVAGSIYKNTSVFIESEIDDNGKASFSWYKLGLHNLFGPQGTANIVIGQQAPMEWMPASGRLRVMPDKESLAWGPNSSGGAGKDPDDKPIAEDSVGLAGARPAISFYGYQGPVVYFAGVSPGDKAGEDDLNKEVNYWAGGRVEATEGSFEGSAIGLFAMRGIDTAGTATVSQTKNAFTRYSIQGVLRSGPLDFTAAYTFGDDDNWTLATTSQEQKFAAYFAQAAYLFGSDNKYYATLRYEKLGYDDKTLAASDDNQNLGASIWYFPMENLKIGLTALLDVEHANAHMNKSNLFHLTIRTMF